MKISTFSFQSLQIKSIAAGKTIQAIDPTTVIPMNLDVMTVFISSPLNFFEPAVYLP